MIGRSHPHSFEQCVAGLNLVKADLEQMREAQYQQVPHDSQVVTLLLGGFSGTTATNCTRRTAEDFARPGLGSRLQPFPSVARCRTPGCRQRGARAVRAPRSAHRAASRSSVRVVVRFGPASGRQREILGEEGGAGGDLDAARRTGRRRAARPAAPVTALGAVAVVAQTHHQLRVDVGHPLWPIPRLSWLVGEAVAGQRRGYDMKGILGPVTVRDRIGQRPDDLGELEDRSRPAVGDDEREGVRFAGALVMK